MFKKEETFYNKLLKKSDHSYLNIPQPDYSDCSYTAEFSSVLCLGMKDMSLLSAIRSFMDPHIKIVADLKMYCPVNEQLAFVFLVLSLNS